MAPAHMETHMETHMEIEAVLMEPLTATAQFALDLQSAQELQESAPRVPWDHLLTAPVRDPSTLTTLALSRASTNKQPGTAQLQYPATVTALSAEAQLLEAVIVQACSELAHLPTPSTALLEADLSARATFPRAEPVPMVVDPLMQAVSAAL